MLETLCDRSRAPIGRESEVPPFEPHPWLRTGHAQTIAGRYLPGGNLDLTSIAHVIALEDGDGLSMLESVPGRWRPGGPAAVLVHGLAGCARSPYVVRLARKLVALGIRVVRMNLRDAGSGFGLARGIYHAGRTDDVREVVRWLANRAPGSPIALVGFSLGANLALKLAAEVPGQPLEGLDCVVAANPPIDLAACARAMGRPENRLYDWNFVRWLRAQVARLHRRFPELGTPALGRVRTVYEFDDRYTAPRNGFASADDYYARSSSLPLLPRIGLPGLVVHAADDPFIPLRPFQLATFPPNLGFELTDRGGHLGYLSRSPWQGGRRWLDARLAAWLAGRWGIATGLRPTPPASRASGRANLGDRRHA
jgi:predicted alpha/beta-fold hydrolase